MPWSQKNIGGFSHASFSGSQFLCKMREIKQNFLLAPKHQKRKQGWIGLLPGQMATSVKCCQTPANAGLPWTRKGWPFPSCGPLPRGPLSARPMTTGRTVLRAASLGADGEVFIPVHAQLQQGTGCWLQTAEPAGSMLRGWPSPCRMCLVSRWTWLYPWENKLLI